MLLKSRLPSRLAWSSGLALALLASPASADVAVQVDANTTHQTIEGYGATTISLAFGATDNVPPALRAQAIEALYNQIKLNMGNLEVGPFESPSSALYSPANDDSDPATFNASGFNWTQSDNMKALVVDPGSVYGFDDYYLGPAISETYEFAWAKALRSSNYNAYLDECAEHVAALVLHWRDAYGINPPLLQLWNEPIGGNGELGGGTTQELVDIVKRTGARLRQEGLQTRFVVPADETEDRSLQEAQAILADPDAAQYVGAVAYHPYPYGSTYASVPNILATSGAGSPDPGKVLVRNQLRDLAAQHGVPTMMVEVSHSDVAFGDFDGARGRAIQIHDEMVYADVAAFFGMNAMWDTVTNDQHYQGRTNPGLFAETDTFVLIDDGPTGSNQVYISEMGRAVGHYARWVPRGSVRLEASSDDPLVQVTAFRNDAQGRLVLVLINNATASRTVNVGISGLALDAASSLSGEQSTAVAYWQAVPAFAPTASGYAISLPAHSITSLAADLAGSSTSGSTGSTGSSSSSGSTAGATTSASSSTAGTSTSAASSGGSSSGSTTAGSSSGPTSSASTSSGTVGAGGTTGTSGAGATSGVTATSSSGSSGGSLGTGATSSGSSGPSAAGASSGTSAAASSGTTGGNGAKAKGCGCGSPGAADASLLGLGLLALGAGRGRRRAR